jgi:hypothetical protein
MLAAREAAEAEAEGAVAAAAAPEPPPPLPSALLSPAILPLLVAMTGWLVELRF